MRKWVSLLAALTASPAAAQSTPTDQPKLIVVISVDQFSSDLLDEYRPMLRGGLARLGTGTVYPHAYQGHAATETCPGHSTILTGDRPARTGIIANLWFDTKQKRSDKAVYCAEDERVPGSSSTAYTVSPMHLRVPTFGERLKAVYPASRSVAVAGKDRAAIMMTGQRPDQRWYWDGKKYATDLKGVAVPVSVTSANTTVANLMAQPQAGLEPPAPCLARSRPVVLQGGGQPVGAGRFERPAGDYLKFRASPAFDGMTLALAAGLIREMKLGQGRAPDLIAVGASATDYVGHTYGTEGQEMCIQLYSLDRDLGDFLSFLDRRGTSYQVILTADHGGNDIPEREREAGLAEAGRVDPALEASKVGTRIGASLGLVGSPLFGSTFGDLYIDQTLPAAIRAKVLSAAVAAYRSYPQVAAVFTKAELAATAIATTPPDTWTLKQRARASFDAERSGDLVVLLKARITPIADTSRGFVATHGSAFDYDRRVPLLFYRPGLNGRTVDRPVEIADIAPTLAGMYRVPLKPGEVDGRCLAEAAGSDCPTR
jgi:hypothetical protein